MWENNMSELKVIEIKQSVFADNNREADRVRAELKNCLLYTSRCV